MDNHYHIVIETAESNLSKGMRQINGIYTQYFNRADDRVGMTKNIPRWKWSSYKAMIGDVPEQRWLETDWILGYFGKHRKRAVEHYVNFVRAGVGLPSIWSHLKNQVFLGTEKFIKENQKEINKNESLEDVPRLQKRKIPISLEYYDVKFKDKNNAIVHAYLSGGYTLKELGDYFGKHYSTISRIVTDNE